MKEKFRTAKKGEAITARLAEAEGNGFESKFLFNFKVSSSVES